MDAYYQLEHRHQTPEGDTPPGLKQNWEADAVTAITQYMRRVLDERRRGIIEGQVDEHKCAYLWHLVEKTLDAIILRNLRERSNSMVDW